MLRVESNTLDKSEELAALVVELLEQHPSWSVGRARRAARRLLSELQEYAVAWDNASLESFRRVVAAE